MEKIVGFKAIDYTRLDWLVFTCDVWSIRLLRYLIGELAGVP